MQEFLRYDWKSYTPKIRPMLDSSVIPGGIERLLNATNAEESTDAYWNIDNFAIVQGTIYDAALPATICIMSCLHKFPSVSITEALEFLSQIVAGANSTHNEHTDVKTACLKEMYKGSHAFFELILTCDIFGVSYCADVLVALYDLTQDAELRRRSIWYLNRRDDLDKEATFSLEYLKQSNDVSETH